MSDYTEEDHQRFILEMSRAVDEFRARIGSEEPDWDPLHDAVPIEQCDGFMWMQRVSWKKELIEVYKHGITRRSLHLDHSGNAYLYQGEWYKKISVEKAVDRVFADIEEMGWTRETQYSEEFRREKHRRLRELGWTIIT